MATKLALQKILKVILILKINTNPSMRVQIGISPRE